jgi:hypothetical protein
MELSSRQGNEPTRQTNSDGRANLRRKMKSEQLLDVERSLFRLDPPKFGAPLFHTDYASSRQPKTYF